MLKNSASLLLIAVLFRISVCLAADGLSAENRLKSCDPRIALSAAEEIFDKPDSLKEPLQLFGPAMVLFQRGKKNEAVFWFYAAQLRVRYQLAFEKGDRGQLLSIMVMTVGPVINNYAFQDISNLIRILDQVLEWDMKAPNPYREKPRAENIEKQIEAVYNGLRDMKTKLSTEKDDIENKARLAAPEIEKAYALYTTPACRKDQLDPAYAEQETQKETVLVANFVKSNKDVIRQAGKIKETYPASSTINQGDVMPVRYEVSVNGDRTLYAIVDVSRSNGTAKFTLACVTPISMGYRDSHKDPCLQ